MRKIGVALAILAMLGAAWFMNSGKAGPGAAANPSEWRVPSAAVLERISREPGLRVKASELRQMQSATVQRVVDGDTVELKLGGGLAKARLLNVDTPETVDPRRAVQEYGREASEFAKHLLAPGTRLYYRYDVQREDRYGRQLLHLYLEDGTWLNAVLIRAGYAQVLTIAPNVAAADFFLQLQQKARAESIGLWQIPEYKKN